MSMHDLSASDLMACANRELQMRERVYPAWVSKGKMSPDQMEHELACMKAISVKLDRDWYVMHGEWRVNTEAASALSVAIVNRLWDDLQRRKGVGELLGTEVRKWLEALVREQVDAFLPITKGAEVRMPEKEEEEEEEEEDLGGIDFGELDL